MLDFIGMVVTAGSMMVLANALITFVSLSHAARIMRAAAIGLWIGLAAAGAQAAGESGSNSYPASHHPDLDYLKTVNSVAPPRDPELLFLLMAGFSNANLQGEGVDFLSARLKEFDPRVTAAQKVPERYRIVARAERILHLAAAPDRLRQGNDLYIGASQAAKRRAGLRRELGCGYCSCRTSPPV